MYLQSSPILALASSGELFRQILPFALAGAVALIAFGYGRQEPHAVNLGFAFFALQFFTRYCDWGWNYLPRSAFFIATGAVLLAGAFSMERQRKKIIHTIRGKA